MSSELGQCLVALERVAEAAERLGLDAGAARQTVESAHARLGFPGTAFVLALAGGTGAGKSSLLNALAGREVSRAGPIRPVTAEPVAWVPADAAGELGPLLRWVGVERVVFATFRGKRPDCAVEPVMDPPFLSTDEKESILSANAVRILGLLD